MSVETVRAMPLYEYQCEQCSERFEVIQRFSDPAIERCRKCGGGPVNKLISPPAIQFKGTGWYITDYGKKNGSSPAPSNSPATSTSSTETKSDTKTETKSESKPTP
jgi:putative FmdB family regulatory protein